MELRHLRYFVAIAEERHITRAAARLGIQQPPLSLQLKALETELGFALFLRGARGVTLTAAGEAFLRDARAILASVEQAAAHGLRVAKGNIGQLAVGFTTSAALHPLVPVMISTFRYRYDAVTLDLRENAAADLTEAVASGALQAALIREPVSRPPDLAFAELAREELLAVLPSDHRLAGGREDGGIELSDLRSERFILVRRSAACYQNVILACRRAGFEPLIAAEVPHMLTNINLVAAGMGVSVVPASMREVNVPRVVYRRVRATPRLTVPLTLTWRERNADPVLANFLAIARAPLDDRAASRREGG